jgi:hypothetical protein
MASSEDARSHSVFKVIFDRTFAQASAFEAEAVRRGASAFSFERDAGGVWMNEIQPCWRTGRVTVAGLTTLPSLFCLELLGRDYGMGLIHCAEHWATAGEFVHRVLIGGDRVSEWETRLSEADKRWSEVAAAMAMNFPEDATPDPGISLLDLTRPSVASEPALYSWVLAPARRAGVLGDRGIADQSRRG